MSVEGGIDKAKRAVARMGMVRGKQAKRQGLPLHWPESNSALVCNFQKKGATRPPVHNTTSEEDQKVRVGRTAMAKASESDSPAALLMKSR